MICLKQTKVTEWIISGNPEQYNVVDAFHNLHRVDWAQKANMTAGDIVYIYVSGNVKAIKFKCRVRMRCFIPMMICQTIRNYRL